MTCACADLQLVLVGLAVSDVHTQRMHICLSFHLHVRLQ